MEGYHEGQSNGEEAFFSGGQKRDRGGVKL
jgi:hypothetical protein